MKDILENSPFSMEAGQAESGENKESLDKTSNPLFEFEIEQTSSHLKSLIVDKDNPTWE